MTLGPRQTSSLLRVRRAANQVLVPVNHILVREMQTFKLHNLDCLCIMTPPFFIPHKTETYPSQVIQHPSNQINDLLLKQVRKISHLGSTCLIAQVANAQIVITGDADWISVLTKVFQYSFSSDSKSRLSIVKRKTLYFPLRRNYALDFCPHVKYGKKMVGQLFDDGTYYHCDQYLKVLLPLTMQTRMTSPASGSPR